MGGAWVRFEAPGGAGQFPATLHATETGKLELEVTNLIGGREALVRWDQVGVGNPKVETAHKISKDMFTEGAWGGLSLKAAHAFLLGRLPCPSEPPTWAEDSSTLRAGANRYEIRWLSRRLGQFEVAKVHVTGAEVEIEERDAQGFPLRWTARTERGVLKFRWKDRKLTRKPQP